MRKFVITLIALCSLTGGSVSAQPGKDPNSGDSFVADANRIACENSSTPKAKWLRKAAPQCMCPEGYYNMSDPNSDKTIKSPVWAALDRCMNRDPKKRPGAKPEKPATDKPAPPPKAVQLAASLDPDLVSGVEAGKPVSVKLSIISGASKVIQIKAECDGGSCLVNGRLSYVDNKPSPPKRGVFDYPPFTLTPANATTGGRANLKVIITTDGSTLPATPTELPASIEWLSKAPPPPTPCKLSRGSDNADGTCNCSADPELIQSPDKLTCVKKPIVCKDGEPKDGKCTCPKEGTELNPAGDACVPKKAEVQKGPIYVLVGLEGRLATSKEYSVGMASFIGGGSFDLSDSWQLFVVAKYGFPGANLRDSNGNIVERRKTSVSGAGGLKYLFADDWYLVGEFFVEGRGVRSGNVTNPVRTTFGGGFGIERVLTGNRFVNLRAGLIGTVGSSSTSSTSAVAEGGGTLYLLSEWGK